MNPLLLRFTIFIIAPLLTAMAGVYLHFKKSLPVQNDLHHVIGITHETQVLRDKWGVPHISAVTDEDAFFTMGYVHAQDRLWQMEVQRRIASGRLSEIFGEASLDADKVMRTLGFYRLAKADFPLLSSEAQASLNAYAAGVNAWITKKDTALPIEFSILGIEPEPWVPQDSLAWLKIIAWNLSSNYANEINRLLLSQALGASRVNALYMLENQTEHQAQEKQDVLSVGSLTTALESLGSLTENLRQQLNTQGYNIGSNAWVVSGKHTRSGLPILANDPHVQTQIPAIFYLANIKGKLINVTGATFPGLPFVLFGKNENIAWGGTTIAVDAQDLYIERVNPENPNQYFYDGQLQNMEIIEEKILVKATFPGFLHPANAPQVWSARKTIHGPVLSDALDNPSNQVISLRWPALDSGDVTYEALLHLNYAKDWFDFKQALAQANSPTLAFAYADKQDNIGVVVSGKIPKRKRGDGTVPNFGWDSKNDWQGYLEFEQNPQYFNPESGYLVLANHKFMGEEYPHFITNDWPSSHRATRINSLLQEIIATKKEGLTSEDMQRIQGDYQSLAAGELLPYLLKTNTGNDREREALSYLKDWNGHFALDSVAATIFETWFIRFREVLLLDDLQGDLLNLERTNYLKDVVYEVPIEFFRKVLEQDDAEWCDDQNTSKPDSCKIILQKAFALSLDDLKKLYGSNMNNWHWGRAHKTHYTHTPFSKVNLLDVIFDERIESVGDNYSVNLGESLFSTTNGFEQYVGPIYRQIIDLGNSKKDFFVVTPGQSGNVFSQHYSDTMELHRDMSYMNMTLGAEDVKSDGKLILRPDINN